MKDIKKLPGPKELVELSPPDEMKLPKSDEKLLRAPTFVEKYPWLKTALLAIIVVMLIDIGVYSLLQSDAPSKMAAQLDSNQSTHISHMLTADLTAGWRTYTNTEGKFSLKYPQGYTVSSYTNPVTVSSNIYQAGNNYVMHLSYQPISPSQSLKTLIDRNKVCPVISSSKGIPSTINGALSARIYIDISCGQAVQTIIYAKSVSRFYIFTIVYSKKFSDVKTSVDDLLATIHFE